MYFFRLKQENKTVYGLLNFAKRQECIKWIKSNYHYGKLELIEK